MRSVRAAGLLGLALALAAPAARGQESAGTSAAAEPAAAAAPAETAPAGPAVRAIEVRSPVPLPDWEDLRSLITLPIGRPLDDDDVRRTLANLQSSGAVSRAAVYSRPEGDGVVAIVALWPNVQVEQVRLEGTLGLDRGDLRREIPQEEAEPLSESAVVRGVYRLQDFYREQGFLAPDVRVQVATDEARLRAVVTYRLEPGARTVVGPVTFDGPLGPFTPAQLLERLRIKPGDPYRQGAVRDDAERLQRWLIRQKYRKARVEAPRADLDPAGTMRLTYPIDVGPKLEVRVTGGDEKKLAKRDLLPFLGGEGYDEALVLQAVARLKDYYQAQGHYHVEVESAEEMLEGVLRLTITIRPGPETTVQEIAFLGNETFDEDRLSELMTTSRKRLLALGSGRLVESELAKDVDNIRSFYALQGFVDVEVGTPRIDERPDGLHVAIPIVEGTRQQVGRISFTGVEHLDVEDLRRQLPLADGGPYHPQLLDQALDTVRAAYGAEGYSLAQVSAEPAWNPDHTRVDLTVDVLEGPQVKVDRVIVRGNRRTESEVIRRTIEVRPGDPVSDDRLLQAERTLYRLGIFSRVDVELARSDLDSSTRDVLVRVQEGRSRTLTYGVGYDSEDGVRGLFGFTHNNVGGQAYTLRTDLRLAQRNSRFRLLFDQPYVFKYPVPLTSSVFYEQGEVGRESFEVTRYGARTEATRNFERRRVGLGLDYRIVELEELATGTSLNELERKDRPVQIASLFPSFFWDRRDDPILPTRGWSSLAQLQYAFPAFGSQADFVKLFLQQTQYLGLGRSGVVAASLRVGGIEAFNELAPDDPDVTNDLASRNVFISERFFAGGSSTHRAYDRDELGIRGESLLQPEGRTKFVPIGGNGLLLLNLEYRFPIAGAFGGTLFYDAGNVWADWRSIDPGEIKSGVGVGARYLSPIGPLRVDVGWKLDRERDPDEDGFVIFLSFGNPF